MTNANPKIIITASDQTKSAFDSVSRSLSTLSVKAQAVSATFKGFGGLLGAALSFSLLGMAKNLAEAGDKLQKLSVKTGIAVEDLSKLDYAASLSDLSMEDLGAALTKLNRVMGDAANGSKEATDALARFGVAPDSGQTALEVFKQIADRVKATGDETRVASALNDVLGKSFANLIPLLKGGSDGIKSAGDELAKFGGVMTGDLAKASEDFNDNMTKIGKAIDGLKISLLGGVVKGLRDVTNEMLEGTIAAGGFFAALNAGATLNPFKNTSENLKSVRAELAEMERVAKEEGYMDAERYKRKKNQLALLKLEQQRQALAGAENYGNEGIGSRVKQAEILDTPQKAKAAKAGRAKKDDPYTDLLTPAAEAYARAIESLNKNLLDAEKSTLKLDDAESMLYDLMRSAVWKDMPEPWKDLVTAQVEAASAAIKTAEKTKELNDLIAATPTAKLEEMRGKMMLLAEAFDEGKISAEVFSEAAQTALGTLSDTAKEATDDLSEFAVQAARNMQDAMAEFLFEPFKDGVDGMLKSFGTMVQKLIANAVAADLAKRLFGKAGGGEGDGLLGAGLDWLGGLFKNADGGVYASPGLSSYSGSIVSHPTLFKFANGIGMMGEAGAEAILPLKRGADGKLGVSAGGGGHTVNVYVTGTNAQDVRRAAGQGAREGLAALAGAQRYR
jgi:phage-related minor tail protein